MPSHTRSSFRMDRQIQIKNLPAIKVIYQRFRGDCQQLPPVWADFCGRMAALYPGIGLEYYGSSYDDPMIAGRERPEHPAGLSLDCPHGAGAPGLRPGLRLCRRRPLLDCGALFRHRHCHPVLAGESPYLASGSIRIRHVRGGLPVQWVQCPGFCLFHGPGQCKKIRRNRSHARFVLSQPLRPDPSPDQGKYGIWLSYPLAEAVTLIFAFAWLRKSFNFEITDASYRYLH